MTSAVSRIHLTGTAVRRHDLMLVLPEAVALRIFRAGTLSVGLKSAVSPYSHFPYQTKRCCTRNMSSAGPPEGGDNSSSSGAQKEELREQKKTMRKRIKSELKTMGEAAVDSASAAVSERLLACPQLQQGSNGDDRRGGVSVYLSMPGELGTAAIISGLFKRGKKVYIPKVRRRSVQLQQNRVLPTSVPALDWSCTACCGLFALIPCFPCKMEDYTALQGRGKPLVQAVEPAGQHMSS